jgi:hypothetical protein
VAVCAAIYAATLIAFKTAIPLIPGITEVRVAGIFPIVLGFLFGPAGAGATVVQAQVSREFSSVKARTAYSVFEMGKKDRGILLLLTIIFAGCLYLRLVCGAGVVMPGRL